MDDVTKSSTQTTTSFIKRFVYQLLGDKTNQISTVISDEKQEDNVNGENMDKSTVNEEDGLKVDNIKKQTTVSDMNEKMEYPLLSCSICGESYSEDRVPRNLTCGHSLCTTCANLCLEKQKLCHECSEKQLANYASSLPVNYPLLRIIRSVIDNQVNIKDLTVSEFSTGIPISDTHQDTGKCPAHGCPIVFLCVSCSTWVCQDCLVVDHPNLPRGSCRIFGLIEAFGLLRKEYEKYTNLFRNDLQYVEKILESEIARHQIGLKYCPHDINSHTRLIKEIEREIEELRKNDESPVDLWMEFVKQSHKTVNRTTSPEVFTTTYKDLLDHQANLKTYIAQEESRIVPLQLNIIEHFRMDLKLLMNGKEPIYAVLEEERGTRWALVTFKDKRRLLSSLKDGKPPSEGIIVPYGFVRDLVPKENATIFFEVGSADELQGRVCVRLFGDTLLTRQTMMLCSGERGPSYKNTCFYRYENFLLKGGDYENNNGTGGQPIINTHGSRTGSGYKDSGGLFVLDNQYFSARFNFLLDNWNRSASNVVGKVTTGLDILKAASEVIPVTNSIIRDCGLCFPRVLDDSSV